MINIINKSNLNVSEVYNTYWKFAAARQEIFFKRFYGDSYPWTKDIILKVFKFTNVYRATDRVSQYLIKNVIYNKELSNDPREVLFRVLLFKMFNKIETWELLNKNLHSLDYENFSFERYDKVLQKALNSGKRIFSGAYIMPSGKSKFGYDRKHSNYLRLIKLIMDSDLHYQLSNAKKMSDAFEILLTYPCFGNFLAYQFLIDINYSEITNFSENEFVIPGPGALSGINKCFKNKGKLNDAEIIKLMMERQEFEFDRLGLQFKSLWGRPLQLIDCQNIFCEVDKYSRIAHPEINHLNGRIRIKQKYHLNPTKINYFFPPKWEINEKIK